jgi:hypothetical protein
MKKLRASEITRIVEIATARHFNYRKNIIVPNVSWGIGLRYEADLVVLRPSGYAVEIEIKATESDIKRDLKKRAGHDGNHYKYGQLFRELWFSVPEHLAFSKHFPDCAGILLVKKCKKSGYARILRRPKIRKQAIKWPDTLRIKLLHLGLMRIWGLKENLRIHGNKKMCVRKE